MLRLCFLAVDPTAASHSRLIFSFNKDTRMQKNTQNTHAGLLCVWGGGGSEVGDWWWWKKRLPLSVNTHKLPICQAYMVCVYVCVWDSHDQSRQKAQASQLLSPETTLWPANMSCHTHTHTGAWSRHGVCTAAEVSKSLLATVRINKICCVQSTIWSTDQTSTTKWQKYGITQCSVWRMFHQKKASKYCLWFCEHTWVI